MKITLYNDSQIDFSLDKMTNFLSLNNLFGAMKKSWENEQKDLVFNRKSPKEEKEYFDLLKFFFSPPEVA